MQPQDVNQPASPDGPSANLPSPRKFAAILFAAGLVLLGVNAAMIMIDHYFPALLAAAPALLLVGAAGVIEPRICLALFETLRGPPAPRWAKVVGWVLLVAGLAAGGYISFFLLG